MLRRIQETERHIVRSAGTSIDMGDYIVFRSTEHPKWLQANMMELRVSRGRTLADWELIFREHFDAACYQHLMLYLPFVDGFEALHTEIDAIVASESEAVPPLSVQRITWMFASEPSDREIPGGLVVRPVTTEEERLALIEFGIEESADEPWFTSRSRARAFLESRYEVLDRIGVRWYFLAMQDDRRVLARLGMFEHDGICRLQSVGTLKSHRRRGLGSALVGYTLNEALRQGAAGLALSTETDSGSHTLYANVGFRDVGSDVWVMRFPS